MERITNSKQNLLKEHLKVLKSLQYPSGLFAASCKNVNTGYDKSWLRDNFYECLGFEIINDWKTVKKTYESILKIFLKHEYKIDHAIQNKPKHKHEYIHARFHPETFDEFWEDWGNKQNDSIGAILFKIGELEMKGFNLLKNPDYKRITEKLIKYLETIEYWIDEDNGMWEENEEIHASSVGACTAGLQMIKRHTNIKINTELITKGKLTLKAILPRESKQKFTDLSLLSLIYPYNIVNKKERDEILKNIEYHLVRNMGVIRYKNDHYYNKNFDGHSEEAEWTFGFSWLSIIYHKLGNEKKAQKYFEKAKKTIYKGEIPELYFSNTKRPNANTPLGWSESLFIVAIVELYKKHLNIKSNINNNKYNKNKVKK
jgi:GH15 family glucan-1,4-alpha-glucosidase